MEEVEEDHAFHRMSSQRRRKLWSLAARAAAKCTDEVDRAMTVLPAEGTGMSPFWSKDSLVKTQDSGVSVDLHSDGLQCGSMAASFSSTHPQQRVSFEHRHPSPLVVRAGPRRLHSEHEVLSDQASAARGPFESLAIAVPLDAVDTTGWLGPRALPNQSRKRKVSSAPQWGSADTSGLGSSLDWVSIEAGQQQPIRHASASFLQPPKLSGNPVATRSLDEPLSHAPMAGYLQTPTVSLTAAQGPIVYTDNRPDHHVISMHSSPVGTQQSARPVRQPNPIHLLGPSRARSDRFQTNTPRIPFLVTRSLDQADGTSFHFESASPRVYREPILYQSLPGAIGSIVPPSLSRMNPRSAYCSMLSNAADCCSSLSWQRGYGQRGQGPFVPPVLPQPLASYVYGSGHPVDFVCEQPTIEDFERTADSSAKRLLSDYEPPVIAPETQRREPSLISRPGSIYRRSRTLDETGEPRPRMNTDRRRTLVMYSVPPPTDELSPLLARTVLPGQPHGSRHLGHDSDYASQRAQWKAMATGTSPGLTVPGHRMRCSREDTILEDWDAEQERRTLVPGDVDEEARAAYETSPAWYKSAQLLDNKTTPAGASGPQSTQSTRIPSNSDDPMVFTTMRTTTATTHRASPVITSSTDRTSASRPIERTLTGTQQYRLADATDCTRWTAQGSAALPAPSHRVSRDPSVPVRTPAATAATTTTANSTPSPSQSNSAGSSSSELRCIQARQNTVRSSSNDRPLVNPTFRSSTIKDRTRLDQSRLSDHGDRSVTETINCGTRPVSLPSALKGQGNGSVTAKSCLRLADKRVLSLEVEDHASDREDAHPDPLDSTTNTHLFIDPEIRIPETASPELRLIQADPVSEANWLTAPKSTRSSQTQSATGFGPRRTTTVGTTAVPYDQSRLAIHITTSEVDQFAEYWDHSVFAAARISALGLATVATVCLICSAGASTWIYQGTEENMTYSGFWKRCHYVNRTCEFTIPFLTKRDGWQDGALCILILAILLGILGTSLALAGHVVFALSKRLYYFHSSGEAHVVAAFVTGLATLIFHVTALVHLQSDWSVHFGAAYGVSWFACFLHLICALLLSLDEVLHRLAVLSGRFVCIRYCMHGLIRCYARVQAKRRAFQTSQAMRRKRKLEAQSVNK